MNVKKVWLAVRTSVPIPSVPMSVVVLMDFNLILMDLTATVTQITCSPVYDLITNFTTSTVYLCVTRVGNRELTSREPLREDVVNQVVNQSYS